MGSVAEPFLTLVLQGDSAIGKGRFPIRRDDKGKDLRINERIRISPIRLIDENNEQVGVIETQEAMQRARAAGLDLVEVAPQSAPPVCRIMDYGKWKYQQKKKEQKAKSHSKHSELKEIRLRPGTDDHDLDIKADKAREFFADGDKVQFTLLFRGRQMAHKDLGYRMFERLAGRFEDVAHVEMIPRIQGRRMTMMMAPGTKAGGGREAVARFSAADRAASGPRPAPGGPRPGPAARPVPPPVPAAQPASVAPAPTPAPQPSEA